MAKIDFPDTMPQRRQDALAKVDAHFNALALSHLHADLMEIATGGRCELLRGRDAQRRTLKTAIAGAATADDIEKILSSL